MSLDTRIKMCKEITETRWETDFDVKCIEEDMLDELAEVMAEAYADSVDAEGETAEDYRKDLPLIFRGLYGTFLKEASCVIFEDGRIVSGMFVCDFKGEPTITYHFTLERYRNRSYAQYLVHQAEIALQNMGYECLYLYLNLQNINAYNLYDGMGFNEVTAFSEEEYYE